MEIMSKEMAKVTPNQKVIKDHWTRTFNYRQEMIKQAPTREVIDNFPAFSLEKIVSYMHVNSTFGQKTYRIVPIRHLCSN